MTHKNFSEPLQAYMSRGQRIMSVLSGEGIVDVIPGFPDAKFDSQSQSAMDRFDPEIDFDPNSYSRIDKFDGLEVGQELVDSALDSRPADKASSKKTATSAGGTDDQSKHSGD
jgi:hypothetical protein